MSTEVSAPQSEAVAIRPSTGEALQLASEATDILAAHRRDALDFINAERRFIDAVDEELTRRLDKANTRSAEVGGFRIETKAPTTTAWDAEKLGLVIADLIAEDLLEESVMEQVLIPQPDKVNTAAAKKLLSHPDQRVRDHVATATTTVDQRRNVTVKPL